MKAKCVTAFAILFAAFAMTLFPISASAQIVAIGGSNTQGTGVSPGEEWPAQLEKMLRAKGKPYSVSNRGVYGSQTSEVLARLDSDVPAGTKLVVSGVAIYNDVRRGNSPSQGRANVQEIAKRLRARGIRLVDAIPFMKEAGKQGMLQADKIHLTADGHRYVASRLASLIN